MFDPPTGNAMYCLPPAMYVIGAPPALAGSAISARSRPVALSYADNAGSRLFRSQILRPEEGAGRALFGYPCWTTSSSVFVTRTKLRMGQPSRSTRARWLMAGYLPLPTAARQRCSPLDMSIATRLPQGGLNNGSPCGPAT